MQVFWYGIVVDQIPDHFTDGIVLAEGLPEFDEINAELLRYMILARGCTGSAAEAQRLIFATVEAMKPVSFHLISNQVDHVVRNERIIALKLSENDVSLHAAFIGFFRESGEAQAEAIKILKIAVIRKWWQFWR